MKFFSRRQGEAGFSLIELMIIVGIIGILTTLALPRFKMFQTKAKMAEVKNVVSYIYTLENSYALDTNTFIDMAAVGAGAGGTGNNCDTSENPGAAALGFRLDPCTANGQIPRYFYRVTGASASEFVASGTTGSQANNRVCPGNTAHWIAVNQDNRIYGLAGSADPVNSDSLNEINAAQACPN